MRRGRWKFSAPSDLKAIRPWAPMSGFEVGSRSTEIRLFAVTGCWMPQSDANRSPKKLADFQQRFLTKHASSVYMELPMAKLRKADFSPKIRLST